MISMAISLYNIKKWYKMLMGNSVSHVNQGLGKAFSVEDIKGYYNDLTEKVTKQPEILHTEAVPSVITEKGENVIFPVAVFQYGLGAYDLFLITGEEQFKIKFYQCAQWAIKNQEESGAWNNFFFYYPDHPYGSMAQGEGASLLIRAYISSNDDTYLRSAKKALDFMLLPIQTGGTTEYKNDEIIMHEYTHRETVLNGWIFSLFGLFDYTLVSNEAKYKTAFEDSIHTLAKYAPRFCMKYWSRYDLKGRIASPFYHHLHIAQFEALYKITGDQVFETIAKEWATQEKNLFCRSRAFCKKAFQKIAEKDV